MAEDNTPTNVVDDFENYIKNKYKNELKTFELIDTPFDTVYLDTIEVKNPGSGAGSEIMNELIKFLDENNLTIELQIEPNKNNLINFYEKFGFDEEDIESSDRLLQELKESGLDEDKIETTLMRRKPDTPTNVVDDVQSAWDNIAYKKLAEIEYGDKRKGHFEFVQELGKKFNLNTQQKEDIIYLILDEQSETRGAFIPDEDFIKSKNKIANYINNITDTPGGSLGAAKLNDPLVFDSWVDNYAKTTTSFVDNLPLSTTVKNQFNNLVQGRARNLATPGGVADAVDVWELGVLGLMIAAVAYKEYDEIPTILTNKAVDMFNSMTSSYGIPPVPKEEYDLDYEFINKVVETGEKFMPTDIIIKKVGDVVKGAAETGAVTGFGYVPPNLTKTDTMETTQKIQPGVQEEKMFEQAKPKKSKATGGAGAKIL